MSKHTPPATEPARVGTSLADLLAAKGFIASTERPPATPVGATPAAAALDLAKAGKLVARREKKGRGGKTVTLVQGLDAAHAALVCSALKKALGCGATVEEGEVVLQGDHVDRTAEWLTARGARRVSRSG
jgi:translation initiation factor 1